MITMLVVMAFAEYSYAGGVAGFYAGNEYNGDPNQSCPTAGTPNPINIASGNKFFKEEIFKGKGEFPLIFNLYYNSRHYDEVKNSSFVQGKWTYSYGQHLIIEPGSNGFGDIEMLRPNGQSMFFIYQAGTNVHTGIVDSIPNDSNVTIAFKELGELKRIASTSAQFEGFVYTSLNGTQETYDSEGKLTEVKNLQGGGTHKVTYNLPSSMAVEYVETGQIIDIALSRRKQNETAASRRVTCQGFYICYEMNFETKYRYIPNILTLPDNISVFFNFDQVNKIYRSGRTNECVSEGGSAFGGGPDYYRCVDDKEIFAARLKEIIWPDNSKRTFEYSVYPSPLVAPNWIYTSAANYVRSYNPAGQNIYTSFVYYNSNGIATWSRVGTSDLDQTHNVVEVSPAHTWDVWNTYGKRTTFNYKKLNNRPILDSVEGEALSSGNCVRSNSEYTYDAYGYRDLVTDTVTGLVIDYDYSPFANTLSKVGLLDKVTYRGVDEGLDREISYIWTSNALASTGQAYRQIESITQPGITKEFTYENGRIRTYTETDTTIDPPGYARLHSRVRTWTNNYTYLGSDADGLHRIETLETVNPRGATTTYTFDSIGNLVTITNDSNHTTTFSNHNARGLPRSLTTANNETSTLAYTAKGELTSITTNNLSTIITYDERGKIEKFTQPDGSYLEYGYSDGGRLKTLSNHLGETLTIDRKIKSGIGEDMVVKTFTASGVKRRHTETRFDALGRFWKMYDLGGVSSAKVMQEIKYDSSNNPSGIINGNNGRLSTVFDVLGRLNTVDDLRDTPTTTVSYKYNTQDLPISVTDQEGLETKYYYDGFGLLLTMDSTSTGASQYFYDDAGNMTAKIDANLITTNYTYDPLNRLVGINYPNQADVTFTYDQTSTSGLTNYGIDRLTTISKSDGNKIEWIYSKHGNVLYDIRTIAGQRYETQYEYNDGNNESAITAIHYPSGRIIDYIRTNGQITRVEIRGAGNSIASNIEYEPFGPMSTFQYGNGYTLDHDFDVLTRFDTLNSSPYLNFDYEYNNNSNVELIQDYYSDLRRQFFFYDSKEQLESAYDDYNYGYYNYLYDDVGNRTQRRKGQGQGDPDSFVELYSYTASIGGLVSQRLDGRGGFGTGIESHTYSYNADGSMATDNNRTYIYDDSRRIVGISESGSQIATYSYNTLGQRDSKATGGNTYHYIYGPSGELIYEINLNTGKKDYVYHEGRLIAFSEDATWSGQYGNGQNAPTVTQMGDTLTINQSDVAGHNAYYAYGSLSDDGSISAKIPSFLGSTSGTEIGLEIRESSAANANFVRIDRFSQRPIVLLAFDIIIPIMLPPKNSIRVSYQNGSGTQVIDYAVGNYQYIKIEEVGANVIAYASMDGYTWTALGSPIALNITSSAVIGFRTQGLISNTSVSFQNVEQNGGAPSSTESYYVHSDHLGTPQVITDAASGVVWSAIYKPFGGVAWLTTALIENNIRFPGQYYDGETGLHYNYFRYYDPETGRYITSDPIGLGGGLNTYAYVGGNPVGLIDPYGLFDLNQHVGITVDAALEFGLPQSQAQQLGVDVANVDGLPGAQDPSNSHMHAMSCSGEGRMSAQNKFIDYVNNNLALKNRLGLAKALHAIQDFYASGHSGFQEFGGMFEPRMIPHFYNDARPSADAVTAATIATRNALERYYSE